MHRPPGRVLPILAILAWSAVARAGSPAAARSKLPEAERWTLPNGLRVVAVPAPEGTPAEVILFLRAGWEVDPPGATGAAELAAGALPVESRARTRVQVAQEKDYLGARLSTFIARDYAAMSLSLPRPDSLGRGLGLLGDLVSGPSIRGYVLDAGCTRMSQEGMALRSNPAELARRYLGVSAYGMGSPSSGLPDPWTLRTKAAQEAGNVQRDFYRPDRAVLSISGGDPSGWKSAVEKAFGGWEAAGGQARTPAASSLAADAPEIALLPSSGKRETLAFGFIPDLSAGAAPLARHLLARVVARRLGAPEAAGAPFPDTGFDGLLLTGVADAPKTLGRALAELDRIGRRALSRAEMERARQDLDRSRKTSPSAPGLRALFTGLTELYGIAPDLSAAASAIGAEEIRRLAARIAEGRAWRAAVFAPPERLPALAKLGRAAATTPYDPLDAEGRANAEKGRRLLEDALAAQGGVIRLRAVSHLEQRGKGTFYDGEVEIPIKPRLVVSLPRDVYYESILYKHGRYVISRLKDGVLRVDRMNLANQAGKLERAGLLLREALRNPAFALIRPHDTGLVRWAGSETAEGGAAYDRIETFDPLVGAATLWVRASDRIVTRIEFDLRPLDESTEEHRFDDFVRVDGVVVPMVEESKARNEPLMKIEWEEVRFPPSVHPSLFTAPARPDRALFEEPEPLRPEDQILELKVEP